MHAKTLKCLNLTCPRLHCLQPCRMALDEPGAVSVVQRCNPAALHMAYVPHCIQRTALAEA
jgi:hypothetical protein